MDMQNHIHTATIEKGNTNGKQYTNVTRRNEHFVINFQLSNRGYLKTIQYLYNILPKKKNLCKIFHFEFFSQRALRGKVC